MAIIDLPGILGMAASKFFVTVSATLSWAKTAPAIEKAMAAIIVRIFIGLAPSAYRVVFVLLGVLPDVGRRGSRRSHHLHDADHHFRRAWRTSVMRAAALPSLVCCRGCTARVQSRRGARYRLPSLQGEHPGLGDLCLQETSPPR